MSTDELNIDEFATLVQETLDKRVKVSSLWPLVGMWAVTGAVYTLALRGHGEWLYWLGVVLTAIWVAGFFLARGEARWFRW